MIQPLTQFVAGNEIRMALERLPLGARYCSVESLQWDIIIGESPTWQTTGESDAVQSLRRLIGA